MGYTTEFRGEITISPALTPTLRTFLLDFSRTRRMKRAFLGDPYGPDGALYADHDSPNYGQGKPTGGTVTDHNTPPQGQPGLWCQWIPTDDGDALVWDEAGKFYHYAEWMAYLVGNILAPLGYRCDGAIEWRGEEWNDTGTLTVVTEADGSAFVTDDASLWTFRAGDDPFDLRTRHPEWRATLSVSTPALVRPLGVPAEPA